VDFFELSSIGEKRWSAQKVANVHLLLQVITKYDNLDINILFFSLFD
jgi:hypothetical protein